MPGTPMSPWAGQSPAHSSSPTGKGIAHTRVGYSESSTDKSKPRTTRTKEFTDELWDFSLEWVDMRSRTQGSNLRVSEHGSATQNHAQ
jgi:hypothetical protein